MPANNTPPNAEFVLARWHYTAGCCGGGGWGHDYPVAEEHILQIMSETTGLDTSRLAYRIVELSSPEIFKYPFAYVSEPGEMSLSDEEVENLHEYIERGGFVMFDDFGGQADQQEFQRFKPNIDRAFPDREMYVMTGNHPLLHNFFDVDGLLMEHPMTQVKSIFYGIVLMILGSICWIVANAFAGLALKITHGAVGLGTAIKNWEPFGNKLDGLWPRVHGVGYLWPAGPLSWYEWFSAACIAFCVLIVVSLVWSFLASYYFTGSTIVYFLLRKDVDGTDMDEVIADESSGETASTSASRWNRVSAAGIDRDR
jgi:hypothetical protein